MCIYRLGRSYDFLVRGIQFSVSYVILNRSGEQEIILGHNTHLVPQAFNGNIPDIIAVNVYMPVLDVIKSADQVDYCCFTGAGRAYQGNGFSRFDMEADFVQHLYRAVIGEGYLIKIHFPLNGRQLLHALPVRNGGGGIHDFKDTFRAGNVCNHLIIEITQIHNRMPEHGNVGAEGNKGTDGYLIHADDQNSCKIQRYGAKSPAKINYGTDGII